MPKSFQRVHSIHFVSHKMQLKILSLLNNFAIFTFDVHCATILMNSKTKTIDEQ